MAPIAKSKKWQIAEHLVAENGVHSGLSRDRGLAALPAVHVFCQRAGFETDWSPVRNRALSGVATVSPWLICVEAARTFT